MTAGLSQACNAANTQQPTTHTRSTTQRTQASNTRCLCRGCSQLLLLKRCACWDAAGCCLKTQWGALWTAGGVVHAMLCGLDAPLEPHSTWLFVCHLQRKSGEQGGAPAFLCQGVLHVPLCTQTADRPEHPLTSGILPPCYVAAFCAHVCDRIRCKRS